MESGIVAVLIAEDVHLLFCPLLEENYQVSEITIPSKQRKLCKLVEIYVFHRLHNDGDVHFGLNLKAKALLMHAAILVRAVSLLLLELSDIYLKAKRAQLLVEALTVPGR